MSKTTSSSSPKRGLALLLTATLVCTIIVFASVITYLDIRRTKQIFWKDLEGRALRIGDGLNNQLVQLLYFRNLEQLAKISGVVSSQPDIERLQVFSLDGQILVDTLSRYPLQNSVGEAGLRALQEQRSIVEIRGGLLTATQPVIVEGQVFGGTILVLNSNSLNGQVRAMIIQHVWQGAALVLGAVVAFYMIARYLSQPIGDLVEATRAIGRGNFQFAAGKSRYREIGILNNAFEEMSHRLGERTAELAETNSLLREANDNLEIRVLERTDQLSLTNESLLAEIAVRRAAEDKLSSSVAEKEVLLREIHHRVRNNMGIVSSLLYLQSRNIDDEEILKIFKVGQDRITAMALVHQKLYLSDDMSKIDFGEYLHTLAGDLFSSYGVDLDRISLNIDAEQSVMDIETAIPCGLIVNELVSNSLKHAFPDGREGKIRASISSFADELMLTVEDNGIGFPGDFAATQVGSYGITMVKALVVQLGGSLQFSGNNGTSINISFPSGGVRVGFDQMNGASRGARVTASEGC